ncbi:hypothetical protein HJC23_002123 [Cyclotella cryptica]|uniref:Uncharacterized protein n=1 Tax=Cyclotella cryptica TaxID=29204 RepID=A0ABD3Q2J1_9STRA
MSRQLSSASLFLSLPSSRTQRTRNPCRFPSQPGRPFNLPSVRYGVSSVSVSLSSPVTQSALHLPSSTPSFLYADASELHRLPLAVPFAVVIGAVILAITAQSWINFLLRGDQGLGAFLSDGTGYNKSGFKPRRKPEQVGETDPLPWLNLPNLDYVDVAGQPKRPKEVPAEARSFDSNEMDAKEVVLRMEHLRGRMCVLVEEGKLQEAKSIEMELEKIMKEKGYEFKTM